MANAKYYVICKNNCKYEGMTKEQIIAAIAEATGKTPTNIDDAFITKIKDQNKGGAIKVWRGTVAEYNAITKKDDDTVYIKTNDTRDADVDAAIKALGDEIEGLYTGGLATDLKITNDATTLDVTVFDYFVLKNDYGSGVVSVTLDHIERTGTTIYAEGGYKHLSGDAGVSQYDYCVKFTKIDKGYAVSVKYRYNNADWDNVAYTNIYGYKVGTTVTVVEVSESTADGGNNVVTFSDGQTLTIKNGSKGSKGADGEDGTSVTVRDVRESTADGGNNIVEFSDGNIVTIKNGSKGSKGDKGDTGATGSAGKDGTSVTVVEVNESELDDDYNTVVFSDGKSVNIKNGSKGSKGDKGDTGATGSAGKDGTSVTVRDVRESTADGGNNIVEFSDGNIVTIKNGSKGSKGDKGDTGDTGAAGTSVTVANVSESTADGGNNVVTFSDGKTVTIKNGSKGSKGDTGDTGATGSAGKDGTSVTVANVAESTVDGGNNVVTFSDGKTVTIKNGSKGSKGDKGDTGAAGKDGATAAQVIAAMSKETWTFTLADGSTVTKEVPLI